MNLGAGKHVAPLSGRSPSPAVIFAAHGLLPESGATCFPAPKFMEMVPERSDAPVTVQGHIITSQGPGTSLHFALKIVQCLYGAEKAEELAKAMLTTTA